MMSWLSDLHQAQPIAHAIGVLAFVCVVGMALGSLKFRGIGLGTSGVLFAGILVGHFGEEVEHHTLDFVKEFGLILFVFTIGLQLGPGFFAALRQQGLRMNALAATVVCLGAIGAPFIGWLGHFDPAAVLGIFSGASTNTPSLGAGTQTLGTFPDVSPDQLTMPALAYAVTYPTAIVGTRAGLDQFERVIGRRIDEDLVLAESGITSRRVVVTEGGVLGRSIGEVNLGDRFGIAVTRARRAGLELSATPDLRLQYGDQIQIVGGEEDLEKAATAVGNSVKQLSETHFIPFFIGITLGIALGTLPIPFPGLSQPIKLGLAGGPLIVALVLSRVGHIGRQVWYMPTNTNLAFREFGISLFFAAVGLNAGAKFFATVFSATGLQWLLAGVCVTVLPLLLVGCFARVVLKMNYLDLTGLLAGSMTDPPALAFACNVAGSDAPTVSYATVFPLTTLLRILSAQILALTLFR
jgi:AspT/YidE/YbjL antiporter-like protein